MFNLLKMLAEKESNGIKYQPTNIKGVQYIVGSSWETGSVYDYGTFQNLHDADGKIVFNARALKLSSMESLDFKESDIIDTGKPVSIVAYESGRSVYDHVVCIGYRKDEKLRKGNYDGGSVIALTDKLQEVDKAVEGIKDNFDFLFVVTSLGAGKSYAIYYKNKGKSWKLLCASDQIITADIDN